MHIGIRTQQLGLVMHQHIAGQLYQGYMFQQHKKLKAYKC